LHAKHPASRTVRGLDELLAYRQDWSQMLGELRFESERIIEGDDVVVSIGRISGTGAGSGAATEVPIGFVLRFRAGSVIKVEEFLDPDEALEAAGLRE
jgi:ketosteroid isomerase-like protein